MEHGVPQKAKKRVVDTTAIVEVKLQQATPPSVKSLHSKHFQGQSFAGFVVVHQALVALLPEALHAKLPRLDPQRPMMPAQCDYTWLIDWLQLPRFATQAYAHNWMDYFGKKLQSGRLQVVDRLTELIDFGAEPQSRQQDLYFAWWEMEFMQDAKQPRMPAIVESVMDARMVLSVERLKIIEQYPKVIEARNRYLQGAKSLKLKEWNQRSVMGLLGYAVGWSGPMKDQRRAALEACLLLTEAELPETQRRFWGARGTHRRVQAMSTMIQLFVALSEKRTHGDWSKACNDWKADLDWLRATWLLKLEQ
jgi:hypothetical protein